MKKMKKIFQLTGRVLSGIVLVLMCCLVVLVLSSKASGGEPTIFGYQIKVVLSGSMEPTFKTGSIIAIKLGDGKNSYQKKDVITFKDGEKLITHRIIGIKKVNGHQLYQTKGDNNDAPDMNLVMHQNVIGKYTNFTIPYMGYVINFANSKIGAALLLIIPGIILVLSSGWSILRTMKEVEVKSA